MPITLFMVTRKSMMRAATLTNTAHEEGIRP